MRAMLLRAAAPLAERPQPLEAADVPAPTAGAGELLIRVSVCGVCRTDLEIAEGRLEASHYPVIPGHQVIGRVAALGAGASGFAVGDRVGVAWIHGACGVCRWCRSDRENLCPEFESTGCDAEGGYAEFMTVRADFAHAIPEGIPDAAAAPLLCAGAIGWRALKVSGLRDGEALGLTGFGASAHLVLQIATRLYPRSPVHVFARSERERAFARELGAAWAGDTSDEPPMKLAAIIDTTPAWKPVIEALSRLEAGGRLVVNAIRKDSRDHAELERLDYATHLWMEREIRSVANVTRNDVREMIAAAARWGLSPTVEELPLERANDALARMARGAGLRGALVLRVSDG